MWYTKSRDCCFVSCYCRWKSESKHKGCFLGWGRFESKSMNSTAEGESFGLANDMQVKSTGGTCQGRWLCDGEPGVCVCGWAFQICPAQQYGTCRWMSLHELLWKPAAPRAGGLACSSLCLPLGKAKSLQFSKHLIPIFLCHKENTLEVREKK